MTEEEFEEYQESHAGYCTTCQAWTHDCCEPDAREYECPECGKPTCFGADEAMLQGFVEISEEEQE